jgi:membrane associated rhomboid family serine protease
MPSLPPGTQLLLIANFVVYLLQALGLSGPLEQWLALWPLQNVDDGASFYPWQLVTYSFLHGGITHLLFNMLALYMFGSDVERVWGRSRYLTFYFVCVVSAGLTQLLVMPMIGVYMPTVGASGGVFGLLLAFAMLFPTRRIMLLFPPIPMPAWVFVTGYGLLELYYGVTGTSAGVAHFAHLGGMLGGYLLIRYGRGRPR